MIGVLLANTFRPDIGRRKKIFSHFFVVPQKVFKAFKAFIKPLEAPERMVKIKNLVDIILIRRFEMYGARMVKK